MDAVLQGQMFAVIPHVCCCLCFLPLCFIAFCMKRYDAPCRRHITHNWFRACLSNIYIYIYLFFNLFILMRYRSDWSMFWGGFNMRVYIYLYISISLCSIRTVKCITCLWVEDLRGKVGRRCSRWEMFIAVGDERRQWVYVVAVLNNRDFVGLFRKGRRGTGIKQQSKKSEEELTN